MSYIEAKRNYEEKKRERAEYIRKLADEHPEWNYAEIAKETARVFGGCNKMDVSRALRNQ